MNRNCMNQNNCQSMSQAVKPGMNQNPAHQKNNPASRVQNGNCVSNDNWNTPSAAAKIPNGCRAELISFINEVSFAAYDAMLYLDTHPYCREALQHFQKYNELRNRALAIHAKSYGPLMASYTGEAGCSSWDWMTQPWPWELEGGAC